MKKLLKSSSFSMQSFSSLRPRPSQPQSRSLLPCKGRVHSVTYNAAGIYPAEQPYHKLSLEEVLANVRRALRGNNALDQTNTSAMAFGVGTHMGCDVSWTFIWRPDGAFYEEVRSRHLTYKWGFDGGRDSHCWEVDPTGVSKELEYDDHEAALLGAIIKGGGWLVPALAEQHLDVELEGREGSSSQLWKQYKPQLNMPPVAYTVEHPMASVAAARSSGGGSSRGSRSGKQRQRSNGCQQEQQQQLGLQVLQQHMQQMHQQHKTAWDVAVGQLQQQQPLPYASGSGESGSSSGESGSSSSGSSNSRTGGSAGRVIAAATVQQEASQVVEMPEKVHDLAVVIKLKCGRMLARLEIDPDTWQVHRASHPLCSESEYWKFNDWHNWTANSSSGSATALDVIYPKEVHHVLFQGCKHKYTTLGAQARGADIHRAYQLPASPPVPIDAQYLDIYSSQVPVWQTMTGHLLAECHINGRRAGWMILDTGASGFVIEPAVADQYELPRFGDLRIAGVAGKVKTRFRRASQLRIGPLLLSDPVLMEMCASKLVSGFHDRIVGIAGFDVFRRCRMVLPCHETRRRLIKATSSIGQVRAYVKDSNANTQPLQWPPTVATAQKLVQVAAVQQQLVAANRSAVDGPPVAAAVEQQQQQNQVQRSARRRCRPGAAAQQGLLNASPDLAAITGVQNRTAAAATATATRQDTSSNASSSRASRRRRRSSSSNSSANATAASVSSSSSSSNISSSSGTGVVAGQQSKQHVGQFVVPPLIETRENKLPPYGNRLVEMLLQRPELIKGPHELGDGYIWQNIVMIASLPHIELEFLSPGTGKRHRSLFMVDTGAAGSEVMFHSRASRELKLLDTSPRTSGDDRQRYMLGVDNDKTTSAFQLPQLAVQAGQLPELVIHGQAGSNCHACGSLVMHNVNALFSKTGGLDISLYSAGMVCIDLLTRMEVVLDYPNKRIGWKIPVAVAAQEQQQQPVEAGAATAG